MHRGDVGILRHSWETADRPAGFQTERTTRWRWGQKVKKGLFLLMALAVASLPSLHCGQFPQFYRAMLFKRQWTPDSYRDLNKLQILILQLWGAAQECASLTTLPGDADPFGPRTSFEWQSYKIPNVSIKVMDPLWWCLSISKFTSSSFYRDPFSSELYSQ